MSKLVYFNPNPKIRFNKRTGEPQKWHLGDCSVRSVCAATGLTWVEAYNKMSESALKVFEPFNCSKGFEQCMLDFGFKKMSYPKGKTRETVKEFADNHKNEIAILVLSGHFVCCKNGNYHDVWDCGNKTVYNYYVKM